MSKDFRKKSVVYGIELTVLSLVIVYFAYRVLILGS